MAMLGKGTQITFGPVTGYEVKPLCVAAIGDISFTTPQVDATCYGESEFRKYIAGLIEAGTFDITVNYASNDASAEALTQAFFDHTPEIFVMTWPEGAYWTFNAVITGMSLVTPIDDKVQQTFTVQISGKPDFEHAPVPDEVTVSFAANGGTGTMPSVVVSTATPYEIPEPNFTAPAGQVFDHWIDDINTIYEPSESVDLRRNTNLKAVWVAE